MIQEKQDKKLVLLFGASGRSGYYISQKFLENQKYPVRIVVRNKQKIVKLFKQRQLAFQNIIQGDLNNSQTYAKAFKKSEIFGNVKIVISALGTSSPLSESNVQHLQQTCQIRIIKQCEKNNIQKLIFISAALIQRPWHPITVLLNTIVPNVYHYKIKAQNYLRKSGLKYAIIRPPQLKGQIQDQQNITAYNLGQGDKILGSINRITLSQIVLDVAQSQKIKEKVTFQVQQNPKEDYMQQNFEVLKSDTQKSILNVGHKLAKRTSLSVILISLIVGVGWLAFLTIEYFKNRNNLASQ